jgi:hypothetical protein
VNYRIDIRSSRNVTLHEVRCMSQLLRQCFAPSHLDVGEDDARAFRNIRTHDTFAETSGATGDDRHLAFELVQFALALRLPVISA